MSGHNTQIFHNFWLWRTMFPVVFGFRAFRCTWQTWLSECSAVVVDCSSLYKPIGRYCLWSMCWSSSGPTRPTSWSDRSCSCWRRWGRGARFRTFGVPSFPWPLQVSRWGWPWLRCRGCYFSAICWGLPKWLPYDVDLWFSIMKYYVNQLVALNKISSQI